MGEPATHLDLLRATADRRAFAYYRRLRRLRRYVQQHLDEPISLRRAAEVAAMNPTAFSEFFHAKVGITFREWLVVQRLTRAQRLLRARDHTVTEVAFEVGYRDLRTFERAFKRYVGVQPVQFVKAQVGSRAASNEASWRDPLSS